MSTRTIADRRTVEAAAIPTSASADPHARPEGRPQLGSLLLRDGIITAEQLAAALVQKEAEGGRLGEILLHFNVRSAAAIAQALAEQYGFEFLELTRFDLVPAATSLLPENVARRLSALPITLDEDGTVVVAVTDPTDVMASDDLRLALGLQIRFAVVSTPDLARTLDRCFRGSVNVEMESDLANEEDAPSEDMGVDQSLIATSINCIVAQRLARRLCIHCREAYAPTQAEKIADGLHGVLEDGEMLYRPRGSAECADMGYSGRVAIYEVMPIGGKIRHLIEASTEEIFAAAVGAGMITLREDGIRLCRAGVTSLEEIHRVTGDRLM